MILNRKNFAEYMAQYEGQKVVILCARYQYRGTVSEVGEDFCVLANPDVIEVSGSAQADRPERTDSIPESIPVKYDAIEMCYRPAWIDAEGTSGQG